MKSTDALPGRWAEVELRHPASYVRIDGPVPAGPDDGVGLLLHAAGGPGGASVALPQTRTPGLLTCETVEVGGARVRLRPAA